MYIFAIARDKSSITPETIMAVYKKLPKLMCRLYKVRIPQRYYLESCNAYVVELDLWKMFDMS